MTGRRAKLFVFIALISLGLLSTFPTATAQAQERRERETNAVYAQRRAKLAAQFDGPIGLWGYTGRGESSQAHVFAQEEKFYYSLGHNEEGPGLILLPSQNDGNAVASTASHTALAIGTTDQRWAQAPGE